MADENQLTPDTKASPENETLGQEGGRAGAKSYADGALANSAEGAAQPEAAAAMTGHQVWTTIHANSKLASFAGAPGVAPSVDEDTDAKAAAPAPSGDDEAGHDVHVPTTPVLSHAD